MKFLTTFIFISISTPCLAENVVDGTIERFTSVLSRAEVAIESSVTALFWALVTISFTYQFIRHALSTNEFRSFLAELVTKILSITFFYWCIKNTKYWTNAVIDSFKKWAEIANRANGNSAEISPSYIFESATKMVSKIIDSTSELDYSAMFVGILMSIAILFSFIYLIAIMVLALVEAEFVIIFNLILFAFAGLEFTKEIAIASFRYTVSVGLKLFTIFFLVGVGEGIALETLNTQNITLKQIISSFGAVSFFLILVKQLPDTVQSIVAGVSLTNSQGASNTISSQVLALAGSGMAAKEVLSSGLQNGSGLKGVTKEVIKSFSSAAAGDFSDKLKGYTNPHIGNYGGRLAAKVIQNNRLNKINDQLN